MPDYQAIAAIAAERQAMRASLAQSPSPRSRAALRAALASVTPSSNAARARDERLAGAERETIQRNERNASTYRQPHCKPFTTSGKPVNSEQN